MRIISDQSLIHYATLPASHIPSNCDHQGLRICLYLLSNLAIHSARQHLGDWRCESTIWITQPCTRFDKFNLTSCLQTSSRILLTIPLNLNLYAVQRANKRHQLAVPCAAEEIAAAKSDATPCCSAAPHHTRFVHDRRLLLVDIVHPISRHVRPDRAGQAR